MSFVSRLRMRNMFPINSELGNARIPEAPEQNYEMPIRPQMMNSGDGLNRVSQQSISGRPLIPGTMREQPLQFGGVFNTPEPAMKVGQGSALYDSYKERLNPDVEGPSNDQKHYQQYLDNALKSRTVDATISQNEKKIDNDERRLDQADDRINNSETLGDRRLDIAEGNAKLKSDLAADKKAEQNTIKQRIKDNIKLKAKEGLSLLQGLMNDDGSLKPDTETATGWSANVPMLDKMPFGIGTSAASGQSKIKRLQSLLTLDVLQELKELSKTGATGMGALNLKELGVLQDAGSMLTKTNMDEKEFAKELQRIKADLEKVLQPDRFDLEGDEINNPAQEFESLLDPNGIRRRVPKNQVEEFLRQGGRRQ